jgi:hypothetical protein
MNRAQHLHADDPSWMDDSSLTNDIDQQDDGGFAAGSTGSSTTMSSITKVLYLTEAGNSSAISATDIHQGALGDCFLLSSIGELALFDPAKISSMIHASSATTETVSLYHLGASIFGGFVATPTSVTVNNNTFSSMGVNGSGSISQDIVGKQQEIWPQVLEEAVANLNGGYNSIANGGYPVIAMEELTGKPASGNVPAAMSWSALLSDIKANDLMVFDTRNAPNLSYGLVGGHAYMFQGVNAANQTVQLLNPWGFDNPAPIPFAKLAQAGIVEIDVGHA